MSPQIDRRTLSLIISERTQALDLDSFSHADWELLLQKAQEEGVAPLVYWSLSRSGKISHCPKPVQNSLRATYYGTRMNNEQILEELAILSRLFAEAEIPVVALKGICFALTIYPEPGLRPMVDLDLLVPVSKLFDAVRIAKGIGYIEPVPEAFPGLNSLLLHSVDLQKESVPYTSLELHYSLVAEKSFIYAAPVDWFWTQTEPLRFSASMPGLENLLMLSPTAQVLYACAHAMLKHGARNTSMRWFYDLDRLIRVHAKRIDWDLLLAQAREFEWGSGVSAALSQTVNLFETPVPAGVLEELADISDGNTELIAAYQELPATHTQEEYQKLKFLDWPARIRMVLALLVPDPAYMRWRYGLKSSWALPAYYLYRWWGILKDTLATAALLMRTMVFRAAHPNVASRDVLPENSKKLSSF